MPTADDDLILTREALEIIGRSDPSTISRYVAIGRLTPALKMPGKRGAYMFHRADVERLRDELAAAEASA